MAAELPHGPFGRLLTTYRLMTRPVEWMERWSQRYGRVFTLKAINGDLVVFSSAAAAKEIFSAPPDICRPFAIEAFRGLLGRTSILTTQGARHRNDRRLLMPPFHGERMRAYAASMRASARHYIERACAQERSTTQSLASEITLDVIIRTVFGVDSQREIAEFRAAISDFDASFKPSLGFAPALQRTWFPPWRRFEAARDRFDALIQRQIDAIRGEEDRSDILSLLLAARYEDGEPMSDGEIYDQLRTLLIAGHVTTATNLAWTVDFLWRHPEHLARARAEACEGDERVEYPFIEACWKEALRFYPPTTEIIRALVQPMNIEGTTVPAGKAVAASISLVHRDPELYPNPHTYDPTRFLDRKFGPHEYFPFGGGHRRCIGAAFSGMEMNLVLAALLAKYDIELLAGPAKLKRTSMLLSPSGEVPIRVSRRQTRDKMVKRNPVPQVASPSRVSSSTGR